MRTSVTYRHELMRSLTPMWARDAIWWATANLPVGGSDRRDRVRLYGFLLMGVASLMGRWANMGPEGTAKALRRLADDVEAGKADELWADFCRQAQQGRS